MCNIHSLRNLLNLYTVCGAVEDEDGHIENAEIT